MKNKLSDLNDHLFAQLERLSDEDLSPEKIEVEAKRGKAIVQIADQIIKTANIKLQAAKLISDYGMDPTAHLPEISARPLPALEGPAGFITGRTK
jgi:hypothetical protein